MLLVAEFAPLDREALLHAVISGGGALLLAYALYLRATDREATRQVGGLARCGAGFLASAGASMYLRDHLVLGAAVSLGGTLLAMSGMLILLRDRVERAHRHGQRRRGP